MPDTNKFSLETLTLVRGAIDSKIECWRNISAAERSMNGLTLEESDLEDLVSGLNSSAELTNKELEKWLQETVLNQGRE